MFLVNDILKINEVNGEVTLERVLWIDEGNIICYTVDISKQNSIPVKKKISDLTELHKEGLLNIEKEDRYSPIYFSDEEIPDKHKRIRDERWDIIQSLVTLEPRIYERAGRGKIIREAVAKTGKSKRLIYKYLTQYWQRGMVKK